MIDWPVSKHSPPVNEPARHRAKHARIVGADAVIAHHKIILARHAHGTKVAQVLVLRRHVRLSERRAINIHDSLTNFDDLAWQSNDTLDKGFCAVQRIPEDNYVAALDRLEAVNELVDEDALLVGEQRRHAGAFDFYRLVEEHGDDPRPSDWHKQGPGPNTKFVAQRISGRRARGRGANGERGRIRGFRNR